MMRVATLLCLSSASLALTTNSTARYPSTAPLYLTLTATVFCLAETFSLFSIVQFPNSECTASSSTTTAGLCFTGDVWVVSGLQWC